MTIFRELLINEQIRAKEVRLFNQEGESLGVVSLSEALSQAEQSGLDLVLINATANPAVCKIMDYGKFKFDSIKKEKELNKNKKVVVLKGIQLGMNIDKHDLETKVRQGNQFLKDGNKLKVSLKMKGRQQVYAQKAVEVVKTFCQMVEENGIMDKEPELIGRYVNVVVSPRKK